MFAVKSVKCAINLFQAGNHDNRNGTPIFIINTTETYLHVFVRMQRNINAY